MTEAATTMADPCIVSARVRAQTETHPGMFRLELELPIETDDVANELGELADGGVLSDADIDDALVVVFAHEKQAGLGKVVDVKELAAWRSGTPNLYAAGARDLGLVKLAH